MKGQSHPQRGPGQALTSGGVAETGVGEDSSLRGGGWGLGGPGVALRAGVVPCGPSPLPGQGLQPWCQETGQKGPREEQWGEWGQQACVVTSLSQAGLCSERGPHTVDIASPVPRPLPLPPMGLVLAEKPILFLVKNLLPWNH